MVYFGYTDGMDRRWSKANLEDYFNQDIAKSIIIGFKRRAELGLDISISDLGVLRAEQKRNCLETAVVSAVSILLKENNLDALDDLSSETALLVLLNRWFCDDEMHSEQLKNWATNKLDLIPGESSDLLAEYWTSELDARLVKCEDHDTLRVDLIDDFCDGNMRSPTAAMALSKFVAQRPNIPRRVLRSVLCAVCHQWDASKVLEACNTALSNNAIKGENRIKWLLIAFSLTPSEWRNELVEVFSKNKKSLADQFDDIDDVNKIFPILSAEDKIIYHGTIIEILGSIVPPSGKAFGPDDRIQGSVNTLAELTNPSAQKELRRLQASPRLQTWEDQLRHAMAINMKKTRDGTFNYPSIEQMKSTLAGGPPVNASDLRAVMNEVLRGYQQEIVRGDLSDWEGYWNTDRYGKAVNPKIENVCRNQTLTVLRPRLKTFGIDLALSEAQRAGGRRADILLATGAGRNLPIEAKRHYHDELWTAISSQLQDYADDPLADGFGVYLVFWFGLSVAQTPIAPTGISNPVTANELEDSLASTLSTAQKGKIEVVVLDVTAPAHS